MATETIKIQVNADDLDAKLSKSMRELGVHHDQYGRLINKEGQFVAGLSQANVRMGYYIDSQGKMRDAHGRLVEGLSAVERAMRMYIDANGDICNAEGEFVRASNQKVAALKEEEQALKEAAERANKLTELQAQSAAALSASISAISSTISSMGELSDSAKSAVNALNSIGGAAGAIGSLESGLLAAKQAAEAAGVAVSGLTVCATRLGQALAVVQVGFAAFKWASDLFKSHIDTTAKHVDKLVNKFDDLDAAFARLGKNRNNASLGDALNASFMTLNQSAGDKTKLYLEQVKKYRDESKRSLAAVRQADAHLRDITSNMSEWERAYGGQKIIDQAEKELNQAIENHRADAEAYTKAKEEYVNAVMQVVGTDLHSETENLRDKIVMINDVVSKGILSGDGLSNAESALQKNIEEYASQFEMNTIEDLESAIQKAAEQFGETSEEFKKVSEGLRNSYEEQQLEKSKDWTENLREQMKTPIDKMGEELDKLKVAREKNLIDDNEYNRMKSFITKKYVKDDDKAERDTEVNEREEKYRGPESMNYGSQKLYEVLTQNRDDQYQKTVTNTITAMNKQMEESKEYLDDIKGLLKDGNRSTGVV